MMTKINKRYVGCPVCGRILMKCQGNCDIEITCVKCNREIIAQMDEERLIILESIKDNEYKKDSACVKVSIQKNRHLA